MTECEESRKVKVAFVVNKYATGGVKSLLMSYLRNIDRDAFQIDFVACEDARTEADVLELEEMGTGFLVVGGISNPAVYVLRCSKLLALKGYDAVQVCMNSLNVFALLAAKLAGVPVRISYNLSTSHPGESKTLAKKALRPFGRLFATGFAANSDLAWDWLFGKERRSGERLIVPNAIDIGLYHYDETARVKVREDMDWQDSFVIGHIGRFEYQKNHRFLVDIFLEVLRREPRARLVLVGYGSLKEEVLGLIDELGIGGSVSYLGATEDLAGLYNAFDCFVLPSFYEGLPVVGIEAQATGCPCVFSSEITREASVLDSTVYLSLDEPAGVWADAVLACGLLERSDGSSAVASAGFEARSAAKNLEEYYFEQLEGVVSDYVPLAGHLNSSRKSS